MSQLEALANSSGGQGCAVIAELLNALFDIYADKSYDYDGPVFVAQNFNSKLRQYVPLIQSKFRNIEKKQRDLKEMCQEAFMNLKAFIDYKQNE
jgi:hypothetical protein